MKLLYIIFILAVLQSGLVARVLRSDFMLEKSGNCSKIVSYMESYEVPYLETYKEKTWGIFYKTRARWNYRIETRRAWRKEFECCDGYKQSYVLDGFLVRTSCEPICMPHCGNGTCREPNVCFCNAGYREEKVLATDFACVPVCTHPCVYGKCVAPEICTCDFGYKLSDDHYVCEPVCDVPCPTGSYCSKPNQCLCLHGYKLITDDKLPDVEFTNICEPICERECVHGKCTAPDICTCDAGYEPDPYDLFACKPTCEHGCLYGKCIAPNVCTCDEGYSLKTPSVCEPICSGACVMGTCVAPESCSCFAGYGLLENSKYICVPVCEKACLNGRCTAPGVCTCNEGFQLSGDETEKHICKPHCETSCEPFGVCTAPDVCTCFEGYRLDDKTQAKKISAPDFVDNSVCKPVCENTNCMNGFCSAPETCTCNAGFELSDNECKPVCSLNCVNSFCTAPETCSCNEGYRPSILGTYSNSWNICEPICHTDCINGHCTAPNKCTCNSGYRPTEGNSYLCEPICNPNCKNGICVKPDVCSCDPGYRPSTNPKTNTCDPICHPACETNGICEAPDICICENGYRMVYYDGKNVPFGCEPICSVECGNGTCTAPDLCVCFDGYRNVETGRCEPVCSTCGNGTCIAPEVCKCNDGFVLADFGYRVQDSQSPIDSENGPGNRSRCVPHCENCDNGECEAPGECRCYAGFVKFGGTCVHACQDGCGAHGECIEERRTCECDYGWTGLHCDQPTLCVLILNDEGNRTERLTIIEEQNTTIKNVLTNNPACSECIGKVNNETLCFKTLVNDTKNKTEISCLMSEECLALSSQYKNQGGIIKLSSAIVGGALLLTAICTAIYVILRKRRNRQVDLGAAQIICRHNTSTQGLLVESSINNS